MTATSAGRAHRLGMLTPSSNTVLEPVTAALLAPIDTVSLHVSRLRVTRISLDAEADDQFDAGAMTQAATLLADAHVDTIAWNGTSGSWLGRSHERRVVDAIKDVAGGARVTTSTMALDAALAARSVARIGLWTPYTADVQQQIVAGYVEQGVEVVAEHHLGISDNHRFGTLTAREIEPGLRSLVTAAPDAIVVLCTNVAGQPLVPAIEQQTGVSVLDSVAVTLWHCLELAGIDTESLAVHGGPFAP